MEPLTKFHTCPVCRCHLKAYALVGYTEGRVHIEGLMEAVQRLARELRLCRSLPERNE